MNWRSLLANLLLAAGAVTVPLLSLEAALRLLPALQPPAMRFRHISREASVPLFEPDPLLGWRGVANGRGAIATEVGDVPASQNRLGYRGAASDVAKTVGSWRIAVLGDSMTWGWGVKDEEVFAELLSRQQDRGGTGGDVEILNFALPGFSTAQQYLQYQRDVRPFNPDAVLLVFYGGNDFEENVTPFSPDGKVKPVYVLQDGAPRLVPVSESAARQPENTSRTGVGALIAGSFVVELAQTTLSNVRPVSTASGSKGPRTVDYQHGGPSVAEVLLLRLQEEVRSDGGRLVIAYLPPNREQELLVGPRDAGGEARSPVAWLCGAGLAVVDLSPALQVAQEQAGTPWRAMIAGAHLNPAGHAQVARELARTFSEPRLPVLGTACGVGTA